MKIIIGSDHAGYTYKELLIADLRLQGHEVIDTGAINNIDPDDYPDRTETAVRALLNNEGERAILICGSAVGVSVAANKFKGIRAGICHDTYSAHQGVEHDDMNVLCMGQRIIGIELAKEIVAAFLSAKFSGEERHIRRLEKLRIIENKTMK